MSAFHNSPAGERLALKAHKAHAMAGVIAAVGSLMFFGLSVAGALWHWKGANDHRENLARLEGKWPNCS